MAEVNFEIADKIDITDVTCPITFVKAKVAIEELEEEVLPFRAKLADAAAQVMELRKEQNEKIGIS